MKRCPACKEDKPITEFAKNRTKNDGLQTTCKACQKIRDKDYYQRTKPEHDAGNRRLRLRNQLVVYEYLRTHPCVDCDNSNPAVLTFDHIRGEKLGNVSDMIKRPCSIRTIFDEIVKCVVRCANCHMIKDCSRFIGAGIESKSSPALPLNLPAEGQHISL